MPVTQVLPRCLKISNFHRLDLFLLIKLWIEHYFLDKNFIKWTEKVFLSNGDVENEIAHNK